ncbi:MAG: di-heme oxidoredictase family protein, partial [Myxococcota bacterium]
VAGVPVEGQVSVVDTTPGPTAGTTRLNYRLSRLAYGPVQNYEVRMAPQLPGLGLLEAIDASTLRQWASEGSGRVHETPNGVGRFGWKASTASVRQQVAKAYRNDMGVTSPSFPAHDLTPFNAEAGLLVGGAPEVSAQEIDLVTSYILGLGIPVRRHPDVKYGLYGTGGGRLNPEPITLSDPEIVRGEQLFANLGCASCHRPEVTTGHDHPWPQFRNQKIRPYTDLLLHDMGPELAGLPEGDATAQEWRTPPLWGTRLLDRLAENSGFSDAQLPFASRLRNRATWLHDGRASSREEAILWHGGEAAESRNNYRQLSASDQRALIRFLQSL